MITDVTAGLHINTNTIVGEGQAISGLSYMY